MAAGEIQLSVVGNLTAAPDLKVTKSGDSVVGFTVASTPRILDKSTNTWRDGDATFLRCTAWRDMAESVAQSLDKGARVIVTGRLRQRSYEKDGQTRSVLELEVDEIGPSLRYATAQVRKLERSSGGQSTSRDSKADPWVSDAPF